MALKPGPARMPTAQLRAHGSWHANGRTDEPSYEPLSNVKPPRGLPPKARQLFRELAPKLVESRVLTAADLPAFVHLCRTYALWDRVMTAAEASMPDRPTLLALAKLDDALRRMYAMFGLTPADRANLHVEPVSKDPREQKYFGAA